MNAADFNRAIDEYVLSVILPHASRRVGENLVGRYFVPTRYDGDLSKNWTYKVVKVEGGMVCYECVHTGGSRCDTFLGRRFVIAYDALKKAQMQFVSAAFFRTYSKT